MEADRRDSRQRRIYLALADYHERRNRKSPDKTAPEARKQNDQLNSGGRK